MRHFFCQLFVFRHRVDWYTQTLVRIHAQTHTWNQTVASHACWHLFSWCCRETRQQHSSPLCRVDTRCHCLNPKGFTGQLVHWSEKRVPWGQRRRQTAYSWLITRNSLLLNTKVIITRGTGTYIMKLSTERPANPESILISVIQRIPHRVQC